MIDGPNRAVTPIRWAMVGGGRGSQIGYIHRSAALRDRTFDLVAGAFDLDPERGRAFGVELGLFPERCYGDYTTLFAEEAKRPDGIEAVSVATPTTPISPSPRRRWSMAFTSSARSRSTFPSRRRSNFRRCRRRRVRSSASPMAMPATR